MKKLSDTAMAFIACLLTFAAGLFMIATFVR